MARPEFPRRGAWALWGKKVCIINNLIDGQAEIHTVDTKGETLETIGRIVNAKGESVLTRDLAVRVDGGVPASSLQMAHHRDIPAKRRPLKSRAKSLGYEVK